MKHHYRITVEALNNEGQPAVDQQPLVFTAQNHDDILSIVQRLRNGLDFDENTSASFAVGLKLFTEVLLLNKEHPLFSELKPEMVTFMKKLKQSVKEKNQGE